MSHNVSLTGVKITDLSLLGNIVKRMSDGRAVLNRNAKTFRTWRGQPNQCDASITLPGKHDVGLIKQSDGGYMPVFDPYSMDNVFKNSHGENKIGGLLQEYALCKAEYQAAQRGATTTRVPGKDGVVNLQIVQAG